MLGLGGKIMRVKRVSGLATAVLVAGLLTPVAAAHADPMPSTATITTPMPGATIAGPTTVTAAGFVDPAGMDAPVTMDLTVDGSAVAGVGQQLCPAQPDGTCTSTFTWDVTGLTGSHDLQVTLTTQNLATVTSATVNVTASSPPPSAVLAQPGPPVTGQITLSASGSIDATQTDSTVSMQLYAGTSNPPTTAYGAAVPCTSVDPRACAASLTWDSTGITTTRYLRVLLVTATTSVFSPTITVHPTNPGPTLEISDPQPGPVSGIVSVMATGTVDTHQTDTPGTMVLTVRSGSTLVYASPTTTCPDNPVAPDTCTLALGWDSSGKSGDYSLTMTFTSSKGRSFSRSVAVDVNSPIPTISFTTPAAGSTVSGLVPIAATGIVDQSQTDTAGSMVFKVNGATVHTVTCPASSLTCALDYDWDASGIVGSRTLTVQFVTQNGVSAVDVTHTVNVVSAPPTALVVAPAAGATVSGIVPITTEGVVSPTQNDAPVSIQLLIDGVATAAAQSCTETGAVPHGCSVAYTWDATGLTGVHTLQARFVTHTGVTALSPLTSVTVLSPAPKAVISSPGAGTTVHRTTTVTVTGAVDPSQTDTPASMTLTVDGALFGPPRACTPAPAGSRTCVTSFSWNTLGLTGRHTLVATLTTAKGVVAASAPSSVFVYGGTKTALTEVKTQHAGHSVTVTGRITALVNRSAVTGAKVKIAIIPIVGHAKTLYVLTDSRGYYKATFKVAVNTTVEATLVALPYFGSSHTFIKVKVLPTVSCAVGSTLQRNALGHGTCKLANLLKGTKATLQYGFQGHWYTIGSGRAPGSVIPFSFKFAHRGTYYIRLVLAATSAFLGIMTPSLKVVVT
jgi:hypothetical protein